MATVSRRAQLCLFGFRSYVPTPKPSQLCLFRPVSTLPTTLGDQQQVPSSSAAGLGSSMPGKVCNSVVWLDADGGGARPPGKSFLPPTLTVYGELCLAPCLWLTQGLLQEVGRARERRSLKAAQGGQGSGQVASCSLIPSLLTVSVQAPLFNPSPEHAVGTTQFS